MKAEMKKICMILNIKMSESMKLYDWIFHDYGGFVLCGTNQKVFPDWEQILLQNWDNSIYFSVTATGKRHTTSTSYVLVICINICGLDTEFLYDSEQDISLWV